METLIYSIRFLAISQVLFFLVVIITSRNPPRVRWVGTILIIGIMGYLIGPVLRDEFNLSLALASWCLAGMVPGMILLFAWVVFEEHAPVPAWLKLVIGVDVTIEVLSHIAYAQQGSQAVWITNVLLIKRIAMVVGALFLIWQGRKCDLVETRLRLRWWIIGSIASLALLIEFSHIILSYDLPERIEFVSLLAVFIVSLVINLTFLRLNPSGVLVGCRVGCGVEVATEPVDPDIKRLLQRMEDERLYADHDLRVGTLAELIGIPEYQLRKKINQNLGYRNFNQFINKYRIEEAGERLHKEPRLPVLSVALDVGFRSISSFNTAFQNHFGVSPTRYRKQLTG